MYKHISHYNVEILLNPIYYNLFKYDISTNLEILINSSYYAYII